MNTKIIFYTIYIISHWCIENDIKIVFSHILLIRGISQWPVKCICHKIKYFLTLNSVFMLLITDECWWIMHSETEIYSRGNWVKKFIRIKHINKVMNNSCVYFL